MSKEIRYGVLIGLLSIFFVVELTVGIIANSLSLQTDSFHMLSDLLAMLIGLFSYKLAQKEATVSFTYGWIRAETIGALINSVFLLAICLSLFIEFIQKTINLFYRLENSELENSINLVLITGFIGLLVNILGLKLFHSHDSHDHNSRAVTLHILGDLLGSVVVIINTLAIKFLESNWKYFLDPLSSLLIIVFIVYSSSKILKETINILLQTNDTESQKIIEQIVNLRNVLDVHEFHIWSLKAETRIASLHVRVESRKRVKKTLQSIKTILHNHKIHSSSVQIEHEDCPEPNCETVCQERRCCQQN